MHFVPNKLGVLDVEPSCVFIKFFSRLLLSHIYSLRSTSPFPFTRSLFFSPRTLFYTVPFDAFRTPGFRIARYQKRSLGPRFSHVLAMIVRHIMCRFLRFVRNLKFEYLLNTTTETRWKFQSGTRSKTQYWV